MILPLNHSSTPDAADVYKVEPYVMAGDVYAGAGHEGRGGWTWYTGSAGWMYQFVIGSLLGVRQSRGRLLFTPCFPLHWPSATILYRYGAATYEITVFQEQAPGESWWIVDGRRGEGAEIELVDNGERHSVEVHVMTQN